MPFRRSTLLLAVVLAASSSVACSKEDDAPEEPPLADVAAAAGIAPSALLPRFGGQPVVAGPRVVEVLPSSDGQVQAEVRDATGQPVANANLSVSVPGANGQPQQVPMRYQRQSGRYVGHTPSGTSIAPGPVQVQVQPRGQNVTTGSAPAMPIPPPPTHGGQTVMVGSQTPEVRVDGDGTVRAYVPTEDGELPDGDLYATVPVGGGPPQRVELEFDSDQGCYVGSLGDATVAPGPVQVELDVDDTVYRGRIATAPVMPPATLGGQVVPAGDYSVEVAPVDGQLRAVVYDQGGAPLPNPPRTIVVRVGTQQRPVRLRWNPGLGYYVAPVPPNVVVTAAPVQVEVRHRGHFGRGRVFFGPPVPGVAVVAPAPGVAVVAPAPPGVVVEVPAPPGVVVEVGGPGPRPYHGKFRNHGKYRQRRPHGKHRHRH